MKWFVPSWNGDMRVESHKSDPKKSVLTVVRPTAQEKQTLVAFAAAAMKNGWADDWQKGWKGAFLRGKSRELNATVDVAGAELAKLFVVGDAVVTGFAFEGGRVATYTGPKEKLAETAAGAEKEGAKAAATVKRPTPSCPSCIPGAILPASEVLLSFLTEEQHASWAQERGFMVTGQLSGHRYYLSHRHSPFAIQKGKICFDLTDGQIIHFHDWSVPPEEEVLAAKLILEHHEPWLRNEATTFGSDVWFKNPFGGFSDGIPDAGLTRAIGEFLRA